MEIREFQKLIHILNVAETFAYRSTCLKRKSGAVVVKDDIVISTGTMVSPRGYDNCCDLEKCSRIELECIREKVMEYAEKFMQSKMRCSIAQESRL